MQNQRYPKRKATVVETEKLTSKLLRIYLRLESLDELPVDLVGRHIKLFPFNDDYMKSYTISSHQNDLISLDIVLHLKGRASLWAKDCKIGNCVTIWGPKKISNPPLNLESKSIFLVSDLSGYSTMNNLIQCLDDTCSIHYILKSEEIPKGFTTKNITFECIQDLNLEEISQQIKLFNDSFVILGIEDIKYLNSKIKPSCNIKLKAYWK